MPAVTRCAAVVFALLPAVGVLAGCGSGGVEKGDCLKKNGGSFSTVSCSDSTAAYVALDLAGDGQTHKDCIDVAGTEYDYSEDDDTVCVGDKGADPAHAVNVAQVGNCLTGADGSHVQRVDCTDPAARYRVVGRDTSSVIGMNTACQDVKGTERTYSYELKVTQGSGKGLGHGITFCLAGKDTDVSRTPDNAKVGDCLRETGPNEMQIVDCRSAAAEYEVLQSVGVMSLCDNVSRATATYSYQPPGQFFSVYLCLGPVR